MKFVLKSIVLFLALTLSLQASMKKVDEGSYKNEKGLGVKVFIKYTKSGEIMPSLHKTEQKAWFNLRSIEDKTDKNGCGKLGLCFDFADGKNTDVIKYLTKISGNQYIMPYRNLLSRNSELINSALASRKYWINFRKDGSDDPLQIQIVFPYKFFGNYVENDELVKGLAQIKTNIDQAHNNIEQNKRIMRDNTIEVLKTNIFLADVKQGKAGFEKKVQSYKKDRDAIKAKLEKADEELVKKYTAREEVAKKMEEHNKIVLAQKNEIEKLNMEFNVLQNNIQASEGKTNNLDDVAKQYQTQVDKNIIDIKAAYDELLARTHGIKPTLDAALAAGKKGNANDVVDNLNKFQRA